MKSGSEVIEVNFEELAALVERARQGPLGEEDCRRLEAAIDALSYLIEKIGEKNTTISQLRALLTKPSTEKTNKVLEQAGIKAPPKDSSPPDANEPKQPKPGHGRNGAAAYQGARRIKIAHASLKPGDRCPECLKGKVTNRRSRHCASGWWARRRLRRRSASSNACAATCAGKFLRPKLRPAWARKSTTRRRRR